MAEMTNENPLGKDWALEWAEIYNRKVRAMIDCGAAVAVDPAHAASVTTGTGMSIGYWNKDGPEVRVVEPFASRLTQIMEAREEATQVERARILALLETCRPTDQPYSRRDWALEERGKQELWKRIMKVLDEAAVDQTKGG
jgi:hypothetical protein